MTYKAMFILYLIGLIVFASFTQFYKEPSFSEERKMAFEMATEIIREMRLKHDVALCSVAEAGPEGKYRSFGLDFVSKRKLTKNEGRKIILDGAQKILDAFNGNPQFSQHMEKGFFTAKDVDVGIIVESSEASPVYYPEIRTFSLVKGNLWYYTEVPNGRGYYTKEKESYEEALRLAHMEDVQFGDSSESTAAK